MRNLEPLIAEINFLLDSSDLPAEGQLNRISQWYATEVQFFNAEVLKTYKALKTGNKSRAFQKLSEGDINLENSYELLNFDKRILWGQFLREQGLPEPPPLELEKLNALRELLDEFSPIDSLLDRYRVLVLGDAPAFARHAILSLLVSRNSENPNWQKDLLALEEYRLKEIPQEITEAQVNYDKEKLTDLAYEIDRTQWRSDVPQELIDFARTINSDGFGDEIEYQLNDLSKKLLKLFEERRWEEANELKQKWDKLFAQTEGEVKERMSRELDDILDWADLRNRSLLARCRRAWANRGIRYALVGGLSVLILGLIAYWLWGADR